MKCPYCGKQAQPPLCEYCKAAIAAPEKKKSDTQKKSTDNTKNKKEEK